MACLVIHVVNQIISLAITTAARRFATRLSYLEAIPRRCLNWWRTTLSAAPAICGSTPPAALDDKRDEARRHQRSRPQEVEVEPGALEYHNAELLVDRDR